MPQLKQKRQNTENILPFLFYRKTEGTDFCTQTVVFAVRVGEWCGVVKLKSPSALVDKFFLGVDSNHFGDEHVVGTQFSDFCDSALDVQWGFGN